MRKQTIKYSSPLDALIDLAKRLQTYETNHNMSSEYFFEQYSKGLLADDIIFVESSNDYRHYLALHNEIEERLHHAA